VGPAACSASGSVCVAVRTVVCAQCLRQCAAVFLAVYGSAHGSMRLSGSEAVCSIVRQCVAHCGSAAVLVCISVRQCGSACVCGSVTVSGGAVVAGSVWQCVQLSAAVRAAVHGSVCQCVALPAHGAISVWQCSLRLIILHKVAHNIFPLAYRGNEPHISCMSIVTVRVIDTIY
jgi:hypothetical protein